MFVYSDSDFIKSFKSYNIVKDNIVDIKRLKYIMSEFDKPINLEKIKKHYKIK